MSRQTLTQSPGRVPPHNLEAEKCVLGTILLEAGNAMLITVEILESEDFYLEQHRLIYRAMLDLFDRQQPCDIITVANQLEASGRLEEAGGPGYLATLADVVPVSANLASYARIVRDKSTLRKLITTANEICDRCYNAPEDIGELLDHTEKAVFEVSQEKGSKASRDMAEVIGEAFRKIEKMAQDPGAITGVPTGFRDLDTKTAGLQPSDLIIIAARPSMGKTAFAINIALNAAMMSSVPVGIFSLEMADHQLGMRMLSSVARVDSQFIRTGNLKESDFQKIIRAWSILKEAPIYIDDTSGLSIRELRAKARRMKMSHDIGLLIVDYLQLMQGSSRGREKSREQEISEISRGLKATAKDLDIPVIALSQLNRDVGKRPDKRPRMSDLRESGALEQDADVILFIHREDYEKGDNHPKSGQAEIIIGKQRNGPTGTVHLAYLGKTTTFENLAPSEYEEMQGNMPPVDQAMS